MTAMFNYETIVWTTELRFAIALALGFLVGLERESIKSEQKFVFGGVRTHPIISMFGFGCAWLYQVGAIYMLPAGMLAIASLTSIAYIAKIRVERFGSTSEISALLTFVTGALAMLTDVWIAMAMGVVNTILLSEKAMLESYVERLSKVEFLATVKFVLVTVIILPVLPNKDFTAFHINPTKVWHIVIIVSTLGFVGYLLQKKMGDRLGMWMSGILGGIVSSTALTLSVGRLARKYPLRAGRALQAAILASSVMYLRVLALIWFINPGFLPHLWYRLVALAVVGVLLSLRISHSEGKEDEEGIPEMQNPFEIRPAVGFGILFVLLSVLTGFVRQTIGDSGLLVLSAVVGVSDIDPFILSVIQSSDGAVRVFTSAIMISMMSNTIAKGIYFAFLSPTTRKGTIWRFVIWAGLHLPMIVG
jgi:uncharacterized membrane protein (DUF4010 family)